MSLAAVKAAGSASKANSVQTLCSGFIRSLFRLLDSANRLWWRLEARCCTLTPSCCQGSRLREYLQNISDARRVITKTSQLSCFGRLLFTLGAYVAPPEGWDHRVTHERVCIHPESDSATESTQTELWSHMCVYVCLDILIFVSQKQRNDINSTI